MVVLGSILFLDRITPDLAQRILARCEQPEDLWHPDYPLSDELEPLRTLASAKSADAVFTMYIIRRVTDRLAVGGFGFFGLPDAQGRVEFGYGIVPGARGRGLATEAVLVGMEHAARHGARTAAADTDESNIASQRVLLSAGFSEIRREGSVVFYERTLATRHCAPRAGLRPSAS